MKRCKTCNLPLIICYFIMGWPFQKRAYPFKLAKDCTDLLPYKVCEKIWFDIKTEVANHNEGE